MMGNQKQAPKKTPDEPKKKASRLGNATTGKLDRPLRYCFYGAEAVGKTTLAAHAPNPIFIDIENGSAQLDVARYTFDDDGRISPLTFQEVMEAITDLIQNEHDYKTLVIDSVDMLEGIIWDFCRQRDSGTKSEMNKTGRKLDSIEAYGFGKGYNAALAEFRKVLKRLETLQDRRKMQVIFVGHSMVKLWKNPAGEDYDRYWIHAHHSIGGQIKKWCDVLGFCQFEDFSETKESTDRVQGFSTGKRILCLEHEAAFDAKSRIPMPKRIVMDITDPWGPFSRAIEEGKKWTPAQHIEAIELELARIGDPALTTKVMGACKGVTDTALLNRYRLRTCEMKPMPKEEATENDE